MRKNLLLGWRSVTIYVTMTLHWKFVLWLIHCSKQTCLADVDLLIGWKSCLADVNLLIDWKTCLADVNLLIDWNTCLAYVNLLIEWKSCLADVNVLIDWKTCLADVNLLIEWKSCLADVNLLIDWKTCLADVNLLIDWKSFLTAPVPTPRFWILSATGPTRSELTNWHTDGVADKKPSWVENVGKKLAYSSYKKAIKYTG